MNEVGVHRTSRPPAQSFRHPQQTWLSLTSCGMDSRPRLPIHRQPLYEDRVHSPGNPSSNYAGSFRSPSVASSRQDLVPSTPRQFHFSDERIPTLARRVPEPYLEKPTSKSRTRLALWAVLLVFLVAAAVVLPIFFLVIRPGLNHSSTTSQSSNDANGGNDSSNDGTSSRPAGGNPCDTTSATVHPNRSDPSSLGIPPEAIGTYFDSTKWLDWTDFNVTYTDVTVGGLPIMVHLLNILLAHRVRDSIALGITLPSPIQMFPPSLNPSRTATNPSKELQSVGGSFLRYTFVPLKANYSVAFYHSVLIQLPSLIRHRRWMDSFYIPWKERVSHPRIPLR